MSLRNACLSLHLPLHPERSTSKLPILEPSWRKGSEWNFELARGGLSKKPFLPRVGHGRLDRNDIWSSLMDKAVRQIDVLLFDDMNILDIAGPVETFRAANDAGRTAYKIRYVSIGGKSVRSSCGLTLLAEDGLSSASDDLLVPGGPGIVSALQNGGINDLISNWQSGRRNGRVISVCSGALLLAKAGILDGVLATTHWSRGHEVLEKYPNVIWDTNRLYCDSGRVMTSAGVTSGIDLALAIVRRDCGPSVALYAARELVVYLQRSGGQHQFGDLLEFQFSADRQLRKLVDQLTANPERRWSLDEMAGTAGVTPRTLSRRFSQHYGLSPVKFLERLRVKRASDAISTGTPVGRAIAVSGFGGFQQMQRAFKRQLGTTIGEYQERFCRQGADTN